MNDTTETPHSPVMETTARSRRFVSAVWLVPIIAVMIALAIAWQSYSNRGVLITIAFPDASGVSVAQTTLRFREVTVGVVEEIGFTSDLSQVNVSVRVSRNIAPYLDDDASFWVVQPEVSARGVEGLNTILSGTYIEGTWDNEIDTPLTEFQGDERAPIVPPGVEGTAITLSTRESSRLGPGSPILYRGIEVGQVAQPRLSPDGSQIRIDAFVRAPYDRQLSTATRFWDASGVSVGLGAGGVDLRIGSLASILEGGVTFDTLISGGDVVESGHVFNIFEDEPSARASTFETPATRSIYIATLFPSAMAGLSEGATVRYQGVRVGSVSSITGFIRPDDPSQTVQLLAVMTLQPIKMGLEDMSSDLQGFDFISDLVASGMRAQLASTSLFGGDLAIELVNVDGATGGTLEIGVADNPLMPSVESEDSGLAASAAGVMDRIADLPVEELLTSATDLLNNLNRIAGSDETRAIPGAALAAIEDGRGLIRDGRSIIASPQVASVLLDLESAATNVATLTESVVADNLIGQLSETLESAGEAARNIAVATVDLDALTDRLTQVATDAGTILADEATQALPAAALAAVEQGEGLLRDGRDLLASAQIDTILSDIETVSGDVQGIVSDVAASGLAPRLTDAIAAATDAARNIAEGTVDLAAVTENINRLVADADILLADPATQALPGAALALVEDGRALVASPELQQIVTDLAATTADIRTITAQLAAEQAGARLTAALDAAASAATSVADGVENLPDLSASAERILAQAETIAEGLNRLTAKAEALALDELVNSTTDLMQTADAFLSSDEADDIPVALVATLEELRVTIETIRTGGTLDNLNTTLRSTAGAADSIAVSARDLPALVARLQALTVSATGVLDGYGPDSRVNQELFSALRAATRAAEDVSSLSRTIERNPNSLLLGR
ncbi:MlaD family protein [Jannaschia sp. 2305UL9-9]|uniref:PqiB family protein n=1 Tax=Jannaschia sp. 2305UL9-9 TaxID=3121638 RepID=UPI0035270D20